MLLEPADARTSRVECSRPTRRRTKFVLLCTLLLGACGGDAAVEEPVPLPDRNAIEYPVALWDRQVQGETEVMIHVDAAGAVDSALVSQSSGYAEFDSAAVRGALKLRFTPGRRGDRRIAMWTRLPIRFAQDSTATIGPPRASGVRND
jgi:TonB family protein